ncbi:mannan endo-1,4-beta-mannosidase-like [Liolophura sinensis]|uniref:mannan endo-1,4-beta-mannosidase-like n=1 Tax=Liolophura sinensis TaxID=3198878 RepID=UPI003158F3FE
MSAGRWAVCFLCGQFLILSANSQSFLQVKGKNLTLNGEKVFLSGMNQAWVHYGSDFGNGNYEKSKVALYQTIDHIHNSGGNSMRVWLHVGGSSTPMFNSSGFVTGLDKYILSDLRDFLLRAQSRNVLINFSLWNCLSGNLMKGLYTDEMKLQSYIDNALRPMVRALRDLRALGSWEIINEPEGCIAKGVYNKDHCFDTRLDPLPWEGGSWEAKYPRYDLSRFISRQASAIHQEDPKALVTVGIWTWFTILEKWPRTNFYSDACLNKAGGVTDGHLDFYQIHTYDILGFFSEHAPFKVNASYYLLDKPLVIGEFSQKKGGGFSSKQLFTHAYEHGYSGAWSWCALDEDGASDNLTVQMLGMSALKGRNNQSLGGRIDIIINDTLSRSSNIFCTFAQNRLAIFYFLLLLLLVLFCIELLRIVSKCIKGVNSKPKLFPFDSKTLLL